MNAFNLKGCMEVDVSEVCDERRLNKTGSIWTAVTAITGIFALRVFGFMAVLPLLMIHGQQYTGATPMRLGWAIGVYGLAQAIMQMVMGALSDRIGRHRVIFIGLSLLVIGSCVAAEATSVGMLILGRGLQGLGAIGSTLMALLSDLVPESDRGKAMACVGIGIGGAFWLSIVLGPVLFPIVGLTGLFGLMAILGLCAMVILLGCVPKVQVFRPQQPIWRSWLQVLKHKTLIRFDVGVACVHAAFTVCFAFLPEALGVGQTMSTQAMWKVSVPALCVALAISFPIIVWAERHQRLGQALRYAAGLLGGACLIWALGPHQWIWLFPGLMLFLSGFNVLEALLMAGVSRSVSRSERGSALGVYSTAQFFGIFLGGTVGGMLRETVSLTGVFLFSFGVVCLLGICLFGMEEPLGQRKEGSISSE